MGACVPWNDQSADPTVHVSWEGRPEPNMPDPKAIVAKAKAKEGWNRQAQDQQNQPGRDNSNKENRHHTKPSSPEQDKQEKSEESEELFTIAADDQDDGMHVIKVKSRTSLSQERESRENSLHMIKVKSKTSLSQERESLKRPRLSEDDGHHLIKVKSRTSLSQERESLKRPRMSDSQDDGHHLIKVKSKTSLSQERESLKRNSLPIEKREKTQKADERQSLEVLETAPVKQISGPIFTDDGERLVKKLATGHEQPRSRECQVFFTKSATAHPWPHLVVTVGEDWKWIKIMRKAIANIQKALTKGDRHGTHDWVFRYDVNHDVTKMRRELFVLLGNGSLKFRDSNLNKTIKEASDEFVNKVWILPKK